MGVQVETGFLSQWWREIWPCDANAIRNCDLKKTRKGDILGCTWVPYVFFPVNCLLQSQKKIEKMYLTRAKVWRFTHHITPAEMNMFLFVHSACCPSKWFTRHSSVTERLMVFHHWKGCAQEEGMGRDREKPTCVFYWILLNLIGSSSIWIE